MEPSYNRNSEFAIQGHTMPRSTTGERRSELVISYMSSTMWLEKTRSGKVTMSRFWIRSVRFAQV